MAGHIVRPKFRGLQRRLKDWCVVSQLTSRVRERRLRNSILRAQVIVERGPIWAIEVVGEIAWSRAILIAWPEVDPCFPLSLNSSHIAQLNIDLCQGGSRNGAGLQLQLVKA